ncbi:MAG: carbohydrate ABC transporter permease [Clostridiales bacterium]|nr:carbohydrate ABC transporter permease [Clostridiales bacterium]
MEERDLYKKPVPASERCFRIFTWTVFIVSSIVALYPILRLIPLSFSSVYDVADKSFALRLFPRSPTLKNWELVLFKNTNYRKAFLVSVERTVLGTLTSVLACAVLAFILSRKKFVFRTMLSRFWVFTMFISAGMVPTLVLYRKLDLIQSFWVYIIPGMVCVLHVLLMRSYMETIPDSLEESAQLDGAGYLRIFWSIVCPQCRAIYAVVALFTAANHWGSWFDTLLFNRMNQELSTIQFELFKVETSAVNASNGYVDSTVAAAPSRAGVASAVMILAILPMIILYPFLQKHFLTAVKIRGIKE